MRIGAVLAVGQGALGAVMTAVPHRVANWSAGRGEAPPAWIVRLLGGRMVAQAGALQVVGRDHRDDLPAALRIGAVVDLLHGASMVAAALAYPRFRRSALLSAGLALASASAGKAAAR